MARRRPGAALGIALLSVAALRLTACGGKSDSDAGGGASGGTTAATGGSGSDTGGGAGDATGGSSRGGSAQGGTGGGGAGVAGMARGGSVGLAGMTAGGRAGSSGGRGGGASAGTGGDGGGGGEPSVEPTCDLEVGSLCIVGTPTTGGHELDVGMPMVLSMRPAGCFSSSCTKLVESSCNYLSGGSEIFISGFFCVTSEGDACTGDCGGAPEATCEPGLTLTAGEYTVSVSGAAGATLSKLKFTVPGVVAESERCTH